MKNLNVIISTVILAPFLLPISVFSAIEKPVTNEVIEDQNNNLLIQTENKGFGPQSPRDIDVKEGTNKRLFSASPHYTKMNLCNIHLHKNAEHKGGEFTTYAGNGDGQGYHSGYKYAGQLTAKELTTYSKTVGESEHSSIFPGDTLEVHYVYTTAKVKPGVSLNACFNQSINNPQLRVEAQVYVAVNDDSAKDFASLTNIKIVNGLYQVMSIPKATGTPIQYAGSTTGPSYNEKGSPFQVTWSVRPKIEKVSISSIDHWLQGNVFQENHAHGVRNLVTHPSLLSTISSE